MVPEVVRYIITHNRSIHDCLRMGIVNYTALAIKIQPDVERELGRAINPNTLVVAIKRYADSYTDMQESQDEQMLKNARLSLTDGMLDIRLSVEEVGMAPADILARFAKVTDNYEFFRMADSVRFLVEDGEPVRRAAQEMGGRRTVNSGLARIRISIPPSQAPPDVISYVAEVLHSNGIKLRNAYFSNNDTIILIDEKDASKTYEVLRRDISRTL